MGAKTRYFKIGLFVISGVALMVVGVIVLGAGALFQEKVTVETYINGSVQGLSEGSPVKFRGVEIGKVSRISVVSWVYHTNENYIMVRANMPAKHSWFKSQKAASRLVDREAKKGLRARLAAQGLTGSAYLEVDYLDAKRYPPLKIDWKPEYPYLPSAPSIITRLSDSLTSIMNSLEQINIMGLTTQVEKLLESLNQTVAGANIEWLSLEAHKLLSEVRQTNQNLNNLLTGPKAQGIVQNADDAVNDIKRLVQTIEQPATETLKSLEDAAASIDRFSKELDRAVEEVPETVSQARTALRRLDNLIAIPQQNLEETMENIRVITENLRALSEEAKQYPAYTFFGKPPQKQQKGNQR